MDLEDGNKGSKLSDIVVNGNGEIKQPETPAEVPDGTGKSEQLKTPVEAPDGTGEIKHPETHVEVPDGTGRSKQPKSPVEEDPDGTVEIKQSETPVKVPDGTGKSKQPKSPVEAPDGTGENKQSETPLQVPDGTQEIKQSETAPKVPDKSEESKQPETAPKAPDGSKDSKQSETPPKVNDVSGEIKQSETAPKVNDVSGEVKQSEAPTKVSDRGENAQREAPPKVNDRTGESKQSETVPKVNDGNGGNKPLYSPPQAVESTAKEGHQPAPSGTIPKGNNESGATKQPSSPPLQSKDVETTAKGRHTREPSDRLLSFTSSSSSGSDTSFDDLFQVDSSRFSASSPHIPPLPRDYGQGSPYRPSTSHMSNVSHGLPKESPPAIQMMDRYGGYDPSRIPSSVFDTSNNANKEMEWSVASNDSLFSLHLGNNSFSRDHVVILNDLGSTKSGDFFGISPRTPPTIVEEEMNRISEGRESSAEELADVNIKDMEHPSTENPSTENHSEGKVQRPTIAGTKSPSLGFSQRSDGSGFSAASARSFAFPILTDGTKNSLKLPQDSEQKHLEPSPASMPKKSSTKKCLWVPCFSWCRGGCGCSCRRFCSCSSCFRRICCCC